MSDAKNNDKASLVLPVEVADEMARAVVAEALVRYKRDAGFDSFDILETILAAYALEKKLLQAPGGDGDR